MKTFNISIWEQMSHTGHLTVEPALTELGIIDNTIDYDFLVYLNPVVGAVCGNGLSNCEHIIHHDHEEVVGVGKTIDEAFDDFCEKYDWAFVPSDEYQDALIKKLKEVTNAKNS